MSVKHTPAPWEAREGDTFNVNRPWGVVVPLTREECESVDGDDSEHGNRTWVLAELMPSDTVEADARLMAASPKLLAALEGLFEHCVIVQKRWDNDGRQAAAAAEKFAREAIAEAGGSLSE